jgi:subtilisin family serine protease
MGNRKSLFIALALISPNILSAEFIVKFRNQVNEDLLTSRSLGTEVKSIRSLKTSVGNFAVIDAKLDAEQMNSISRSSGEIEYIEPNYTNYKLFAEPADPSYSRQWGLNGRHGVQAEDAWSITKGSKDFVVAVVDTGVDYNHPDLKDNMWTNDLEKMGQPGVDDDGNGIIDDIYGYNPISENGDPMDGQGHGTHCAGVIGAVHNDIGVAGVMAEAKIMAIKIFDDRGRTTAEAIVKGIDYAVKAGVKIMSNSWGGPQHSQAIEDAIKAADDAGILFVAAAGNGNFLGFGQNNDKKPVYPANYELDNIVSIGAIKSSGRKAMMSNYGKTTVDLFAPGVSVYSTYIGGGYRSLTGTSMAAPHVSGVAGLIASLDPTMTALEIKERLLNGVSSSNKLMSKSIAGGTLNAFESVR